MQINSQDLYSVKNEEQLSAVANYLNAKTEINFRDLNNCFNALTFHHFRNCFDQHSCIQRLCRTIFPYIFYCSPVFLKEKGYVPQSLPKVGKLTLEIPVSVTYLEEITQIFTDIHTLELNDVTPGHMEVICKNCPKLKSFQAENTHVMKEDIQQMVQKCALETLLLKNSIAIDYVYANGLRQKGIKVRQELPEGYSTLVTGEIRRIQDIPDGEKKCSL